MSETIVRVENLSKSFEGRPVLDSISFEVNSGEAFAILGRSGTGKSVTLKLIIRLLEQDQGSVFIEDKDLAKLNREDLMGVRKKVGFLFQDAALFDSVSLSENLAFPLRRHSQKSQDEITQIIQAKLSEVGLGEDGDKMPSDLSGGMKKRAGLARALVMDPTLVLVDEPSSGLDRITAGEIYELLSKLKENHKTLIIVTHDAMGIRRFVDRVAVLEDGHVAGYGTPEELDRSQNETVRTLVSGGQT